MFKMFSIEEQILLYKGLLDSVRAATGRGFVNGDQGHLAYRLGANGDISEFGSMGDHPETNRLYKMMLASSEALKDQPGLNRSDLVLSWQEFCRLAVESHDRSRRSHG
jgi:hypothetical protein